MKFIYLGVVKFEHGHELEWFVQCEMAQYWKDSYISIQVFLLIDSYLICHRIQPSSPKEDC